MRIIKEGNKDKLKETKHFLCSHCGCEFEADKWEYSVAIRYNEIYQYRPCPTCGKNVYSK